MTRSACWILVLLSVLLAEGCTANAPKEPINLGHLLPLTGSDRARGLQAQQGVLLAVEEINQDDKGILGHPLIVHNLDTRGEADTAQGEAVRLLSLTRVSALIASPNAANAERIARTTQTYPVAVIVPGELPEAATGEGVISLGANPRKRGQALADYAVKELKAKRAVVLTDKRNIVAKDVGAAFLEGWPRATPPSAEEWTVANLAEEADVPKRLRAANAEVVLVGSSVADFLRLQSQCETAQLDTPLLYAGEDAAAANFQDHGSGPDVYLATIFTPDALTIKGQGFAKKYQDKFHEPADLAAMQAYDSVRLAAETMQRLNTISGADLRTELARLDKYEGLLGFVSWKEHKTVRPLYVVRIHNKEATVVKKFE